MTDYKPPKLEQKINYWGQKVMMDLAQKDLKQKRKDYAKKTKPKNK